MTTPRTAALLRQAGAQHGLITNAQLAALGLDPKGIWRLTSAGVLIPTGWTGIRRLEGFEPTPHQRLLGATWASGPDAVGSHRGAAWAWGLDGVPQVVLEASTPRGSGRRPRGVMLHHSTDLSRGVVTTVDGIPVTEPTRTLIDVAAVVDTDMLEIAFDSAQRQGLTSVPRSRSMLERLARTGRSGIGDFRSLLDARAAVDGVTESVFEVRLVQVLRRHGLPEPTRQVELFDHDGYIGRFDVCYPQVMVAIEADSVRHHHNRERFEADRLRRARAEAIGWRVPTFTWRQVTRRPSWVARATGSILEVAGWMWRAEAA